MNFRMVGRSVTAADARQSMATSSTYVGIVHCKVWSCAVATREGEYIHATDTPLQQCLK